jgi:hypothetical protein
MEELEEVHSVPLSIQLDTSSAMAPKAKVNASSSHRTLRFRTSLNMRVNMPDRKGSEVLPQETAVAFDISAKNSGDAFHNYLRLAMSPKSAPGGRGVQEAQILGTRF